MVDIVTFALENLLNKTSIHADLKKQKTICIRSIFLMKVSGKLWRLLRRWPQKWLVFWLGMGVKKSEKLNKEFSNHERPHLTEYDHIKNNDKRKVALLLGELSYSRLPLVSRSYEDLGSEFWHQNWAHGLFHSHSPGIPPTDGFFKHVCCTLRITAPSAINRFLSAACGSITMIITCDEQSINPESHNPSAQRKSGSFQYWS